MKHYNFEHFKILKIKKYVDYIPYFLDIKLKNTKMNKLIHFNRLQSLKSSNITTRYSSYLTKSLTQTNFNNGSISLNENKFNQKNLIKNNFKLSNNYFHTSNLIRSTVSTNEEDKSEEVTGTNKV